MTTTEKTNLKKLQWLQDRKTGIGGSEVAAIMGYSPWKTAYQVWLEKTGRVEFAVDNDKVQAGELMEDVIAMLYERKTGDKLRSYKTMLRHKKHPYITGSLDRIIKDRGDGKGQGILECKNTTEWNFKSWNGTIPDYYYLQVQHYLLVTGYKWGVLAVLVDGWDLKIFPIEADKLLHDSIVFACQDFWEKNVLADVAPEVKNNEDLKYKYTADPGTEKQADETIMDMVASLKSIKKAIDELKARQEETEVRIKDYIGEAETLKQGDSTLATWKMSLVNRVDTARLKKEKPDIYNQFVKTSEERKFLVK